MKTISQLQDTARSFRDTTVWKFITAFKLGQFLVDVLEYLNIVDKNSNSMSVRKTYATYADMLADVNPVYEVEGVEFKLKWGQHVSVTNDGNENGLYRFLKPGWDKISGLGDIISVSQELGNSTTSVISQNTISTLLSPAIDKTKNITSRLDVADDAYYITDKAGNVVFEIDNLGFSRFLQDVNDLEATFKTGEIYKLISDIQKQANSLDDEFYITDAKGYVIFKANKDGVNYAGKSQVSIAASLPAPRLEADINLCFTYGQSLSVIGTSAISGDFAPSLQFAQGIRIDYTAEQALDSNFLNNYYSNAFVECAATGYEGSGKRFMKAFMNLLKDENALDIQSLGYQLMYATPGVSGSSIAGLSKGSIGYTRIIQATTYGKAISNDSNKTFAVPTLFWMQGESNFNDTQAAYYNALIALFNDLNTDIKAITGQSRDVQFIVYQPATWMGGWLETHPQANDGVTMAMLQAVENHDNIHFGCAMYQFNYYGDLLHAGSGLLNYAMMGAMAGVQAKRVICDDTPNLPITPKCHKIYQNGAEYIIELEMNCPVKPLVFDLSGAELCNINGEQPNYGFKILNSSLVEIIQHVSISRQTFIVIKCSENPAGLTLTYAYNGIYGGGNLRDSQGEKIEININGILYKVHNFAPIFKMVI